MSIIHLKESITNDRADFERTKKSFNSKLLAYHVNDNSIVTSDDFSLDITLGMSWNENYSYNDRSLFLIEGDSITIKPKSSVVVSIGEKILVPNNMFGFVISTGSIFLQHGVQSPSAKVEPGYEGVLILRLVNYSDSSVSIKKGDKIASVVFFRTEHTPQYTFASNSERTNIKKKGKIEVIKIESKKILINHGFKIIPIIISIISLYVAVISSNKTDINSAPKQKQEIQTTINKEPN
ncbi:TPA: dCTP deaminase domain-containing protein [Providencia alcalifaciens]